MNLHHLRYFVTLAHLEHYTKAAKQLSITLWKRCWHIWTAVSQT